MSVAEEKPASRKPPDAILLKVLEAVPFQLTTDGGVEASRQRFRDLPRRPVHPDVRTEERTIDGPAGPIPIRVYRPPTVGEAALPVVVFLHGGGWSVGDLDTYDGDARNHAVGAGAVVVSVDYRLAPEHPYPAAVEDAWAATQWVAHTPASLAPTRPARFLGLGGRNLRRWWRNWHATPADRRSGSSCCGIRRRRGTRRCRRSQRMPTPHCSALGGQGLFPLVCGRFGPLGYARDAGTGARQDLTGLPPAYIAVAGYDPLRDDGSRYAELLAAAGVSTQVHNAETLIHGYLGYAGVVPAATDAMDRGLSALREALHAT